MDAPNAEAKDNEVDPPATGGGISDLSHLSQRDRSKSRRHQALGAVSPIVLGIALVLSFGLRGPRLPPHAGFPKIGRVVTDSHPLTIPRGARQLFTDRQDAYEAINRAEVLQLDSPEVAEARLTRLAGLTDQIRSEHGEQFLWAIRDQDVGRFEASISAEPSTRSPVMGDFLNVLVDYGLIRDGTWVAPWTLALCLFRARWNAMHQLPLNAGFARGESALYWSWIAYFGHNVDQDTRGQGALNYAEAQGVSATEPLAFSLFERGRLEDSARMYDSLYQTSGNLRFRWFRDAVRAARRAAR